jgi:hypothetical protein
MLAVATRVTRQLLKRQSIFSPRRAPCLCCRHPLKAASTLIKRSLNNSLQRCQECPHPPTHSATGKRLPNGHGPTAETTTYRTTAHPEVKAHSLLLSEPVELLHLLRGNPVAYYNIYRHGRVVYGARVLY